MVSDTTTDGYLSTVAESIDKGLYSPPVPMLIQKDGSVKYKPVQWEKDLVMYDLTLSQAVYPDGRLAGLRANIKIDNSKNIIHSRFEILDL